MDPDSAWVPMRWPDGVPWRDAASLDLLEGTPVNCLVLPWTAEDASNATWFPLLERGRKAGLAFVGLLNGSADPARAAAAAESAGLAALAAESAADGVSFPVIPWAPAGKLPANCASPILAATGGLWPQVRVSSGRDSEAVDAGPTGLPWVDSNTWQVRLLRALAPQKAIWVVAVPPEQATPVKPESYVRAVADAAAGGGRWVVSLGQALTDALVSRNPDALTAWNRLAASLEFFEKHEAWRHHRPAGVLGILSDYTGDNEFLATEALILTSRRHQPFQVLVKSKPSAAVLEELKAVLYPDQQAPEPPLRQKLLAFVQGGGLLVCLPACAALADGGRPSRQGHPRFNVFELGRGRVALAKEDLPDPYVLSADTHILLSRRNDLVRAWNAGPTNSSLSFSTEGEAVLQLVNYAGRPAQHVSLRMLLPYRSARLWTIEAGGPAPLNAILEGDSVEVHLPPVSVYGAMEFDR